MELFKDNHFPQVLYKAGAENLNGKYVHKKDELAAAIKDGWQTTPLFREFPKWVGPPDEQEIVELRDGQGKLYHEVKMVNKGGKKCQNAEEERAHLALLASQEETETAKRRGRPTNAEIEARKLAHV